MPAPFRPRLRADLVVDAGDSVVLTDSLLRRRLDLGAIGDVLARMDGRPADEVIAGDARAEGVIRTLLLLQMLEEAGAPAREGLARHLAGDAPLPVVSLPGARFQCQGSGGCCRNYVLGPLTDADVARVASLDLSPWGIEGPFYESRPRPDGRADRYLRTTVDGACVFLGEGARCGLHATYGATSKPGFCQLFPLVAWPTPTGVRVYDGGECVSFPTSATDGAPLADQYEAVRHLLPAANVASPLVHLAPGAPCDLTWWLPVQDLLVATVREGPPGDTLRALSAVLGASATALRRCAIAADGPEAALVPVRDAPADRWYDLPSPVATPEGRAALAGLAGALAQLFAEPLMRGRPAPPFTAEIAGALARVADAAAGGAPLPPEDPSTRALWARAFRERTFGQRALVDGRPRAALLRMCLDWLVARAHPGAGGQPGGERAGHVLASRRLDMPWAPVHQLLVRAEGTLDDVLATAAAI